MPTRRDTLTAVLAALAATALPRGPVAVGAIPAALDAPPVEIVDGPDLAALPEPPAYPHLPSFSVRAIDPADEWMPGPLLAEVHGWARANRLAILAARHSRGDRDPAGHEVTIWYSTTAAEALRTGVLREVPSWEARIAAGAPDHGDDLLRQIEEDAAVEIAQEWATEARTPRTMCELAACMVRRDGMPTFGPRLDALAADFAREGAGRDAGVRAVEAALEEGRAVAVLGTLGLALDPLPASVGRSGGSRRTARSAPSR